MKSSTTSKKRSIPRNDKGTKAGREIVGALTELAEVIESGQPLRSRFTVRTVAMPDDPFEYDARGVQRVRKTIGASQSLFARLLGVSTVLVQHWESGQRRPAPWARRLLDEMTRDPDHWRAMLRPSHKRGRAA
jgi:DNA-binding transcriptional regulator YiaG